MIFHYFFVSSTLFLFLNRKLRRSFFSSAKKKNEHKTKHTHTWASANVFLKFISCAHRIALRFCYSQKKKGTTIRGRQLLTRTNKFNNIERRPWTTSNVVVAQPTNNPPTPRRYVVMVTIFLFRIIWKLIGDNQINARRRFYYWDHVTNRGNPARDRRGTAVKLVESANIFCYQTMISRQIYRINSCKRFVSVCLHKIRFLYKKKMQKIRLTLSFKLIEKVDWK